MKKTGSSFKINKQTKRTMATILDPHQRGAFKRSMIQAQLAAEEDSRKKVNVKDED
jgi:hypothetical protein